MTHILIVDDHALMANGMANLLSSRPSTKISVMLSGEKALKYLRNNSVDLILMDINMPGMSGIEVTDFIKKSKQDIKVIMLSMYKKDGYIQNALNAGADGYLLKDSSLEEVFAAIDRVLEGKQYFTQDVFGKIAQQIVGSNAPGSPVSINEEERKVLTLISEGLTTEEIAENISSSIHSVNAYRRSLIKKFDAKNTGHLIKIALKGGFIE